MDAGWTRWILEQFEFPFTRVFAPELDAGNLNAKYDVLIFVDGAIPAVPSARRRRRAAAVAAAAPDPIRTTIPAEYRAQLGRVTAERTIPQLRAFVENGGTVVAIGELGDEPRRAPRAADRESPGRERRAAAAPKYYVPGSVLRAKVDTTHPLAAGMSERTDFFFDNSPVFKLGAERGGGRRDARFAWFDSTTPLRSGWAWGQKYLDSGVVAVEATVGKGRVVLFGPEILQRAQPHGTFKLLFNAIISSRVA